MTGEDLGYKPEVAEKAKFEYSLLVKVFSKELDQKYKTKSFEKIKKIMSNNNGQLKEISNKKNQLGSF